MSLSLNYPVGRPTLNLDFAGSGVLDPRVSFTRASTASYFDVNGVLRQANANTPRFDYNPATLAAQGLLVEEQRANLATNSADFSSAFNVVGTSLTVTSDVTTSPDGGTNADSVVESAASEIHYAIKDFSITGNATYSFSVFVKNFSGSRYVGLRISNTTWTNRITAVFNPSTGTWANEPSTSGTATGATGAIQDAGNGWYRVTITGLPDPAAATVRLTVALSNSSASSLPSYAGDGTSGVYIWGAQLEAGSFPTSYIPTTTTALTRAADVASVNTLSPWFNASEGTLFAQAEVPSVVLASRAMASFAQSTPTSQEIYIFISRSADSRRVAAITAATSQFLYGPPGTATSSKGALAYKTDDSQGAFDGTASSVDTSVTLPTGQATLYLGNLDSGTAHLNGWLKRVTYYPTRLPNAQLQALTA